MRLPTVLHACLFAAAIVSASATAQQAEQLSVTRAGDSYVLSVPVSRLEMRFPAGKLVRLPMNIGGATGNPRYFYFTDPARGITVSGWFEPAARFKGIEEFWSVEQAGWKRRGMPEPMDVAMKKIGGWDAILYETPFPAISNSHLRAHFVQAGTWIDVHISVASKDAPSSSASRAVAEEFLQSISVAEKSGT